MYMLHIHTYYMWMYFVFYITATYLRTYKGGKKEVWMLNTHIPPSRQNYTIVLFMEWLRNHTLYVHRHAHTQLCVYIYLYTHTYVYLYTVTQKHTQTHTKY